MEKAEYRFSDFLSDVPEERRGFAGDIHDALLKDGYRCKIERKTSGFFVSYSHPGTRRSLLNFFFRKNGFYVRVYADAIDKHADFLQTLPERMEKEISKASACKRLLNPADCNQKCLTGYDFFIRDNRYQKCRYGCFQFRVDAESVPAISAFVEREKGARRAV